MSEIILVDIEKEIQEQMANESVENALIATTFKGLTKPAMMMAIREGMIRGFKFRDFLERNVYAIPFSGGYSLVTSIDYARKIGARSGIVGVDAPVYAIEESMGLSCSVTVRKIFPNGHIGEFTAKVYLKEFSTGRNQWVTKERAMIAKVAEAHALRKACPEELAQNYVEEEMQETRLESELPKPREMDLTEFQLKLESTGTMEDLGKAWSALPPEAKVGLKKIKDELKKKYEKAGI